MTLLEIMLLITVVVGIPLCGVIGFILGRRHELLQINKTLDFLNGVEYELVGTDVQEYPFPDIHLEAEIRKING